MKEQRPPASQNYCFTHVVAPSVPYVCAHKKAHTRFMVDPRRPRFPETLPGLLGLPFVDEEGSSCDDF